MDNTQVTEYSQVEVNIWEAENKHKIVKWVKDFENNTIQYCFDDKCKDSKTFKIENH